MDKVVYSSNYLTSGKIVHSHVRTALSRQDCPFHSNFEKYKNYRTEVSFLDREVSFNRQKCPFF